MNQNVEREYQQLKAVIRPDTWKCTGCGNDYSHSVLPTMLGERITCNNCLGELAENLQRDMPGTHVSAQ